MKYEGRKKGKCWANGFSALQKYQNIDGFLEELKEIISVVKSIPSSKDFDALVERNVIEALKAYTKTAYVRFPEKPGLFRVVMANDWGYVAAIDVDLEAEFSEAELEELPQTEAYLLAWARYFEDLAGKIRKNAATAVEQE